MEKIEVAPSCLDAIRFVRKMNGGSQSSLLLAEDGNYYVVKLHGNPQGSAVLFNDAFGTELMRIVGLHVPKWRAIKISEDLIDCNPELWFEIPESGRQRPMAGLHFGSKIVMPKAGETLYDLIPRSWFSRILNRENFIGMLLFDLWANQGDNRQAVFLENTGTRSIQAIFIDQGSLFAQTHVESSCIRAMFVDPAVYRNLKVESIIPNWADRILKLDQAGLNSLVRLMQIPEEWYISNDLEEIIAGLIERQALLGQYASLINTSLNSILVADKRSVILDSPLDDMQLYGPELRSNRDKRANSSAFRLC